MRNHGAYEPIWRFMQGRALVFLFFFALNFVVHYLRFMDLGLNAEDYSPAFIFMSLDKGPSFILNNLIETFANLFRGSLGIEGRALGILTTRSMAAIGWMIGGVPGMHFISLLISTACSYVMYRTFAQRGEFFYGFLAALFLTLYPAYALRQYLNAQFWLMSSLLFMLLAVKSLLAGKKVSPYIYIFCSLVSYESPVFPFLAAPLLLNEKWDLRMARRLAVHLLIMTAMIAFIFILRKAGREGRVLDFTTYVYGAPARVAISVFYGTMVSAAYSIYHAAVQFANNADAVSIVIAIASAPLLAWLIYVGSSDKDAATDLAQLGKRAAAGLLLTALAHSIGFFPQLHAAADISDLTMRLTNSRLHLAAIPGGAIFFSSLCMLILRAACRNGMLVRLAAATGIAMLLAVLIGYAGVVQKNFTRGWHFQRYTWTRIIQQAPDIADGDAVIVDYRRLGSFNVPFYNDGWYELMRSFPAVYEFPSEWKKTPRIIFMRSDWNKNELSERRINGALEINVAPWHSAPDWTGLEDGKIIYFRPYKMELERFDGMLRLGGMEVKLKPKPIGVYDGEPLKKGFLHDWVLQPGCRLTALDDVRPSRDIENEPKLSKTLYFNGKNHLSKRLPDVKTKSFTIELWLKPGTNKFSADGVMNKRYPPMPAIIGPMRLDHASEDVLSVGIAALNKSLMLELYDMFGTTEKKKWLHVELNVDNLKRTALLFANGRLEERFADVEVPLKADILLGNGHFERFWHGEIADLRISSIVRHTNDFEPEKTAITRDKHTLYLMDGF